MHLVESNELTFDSGQQALMHHLSNLQRDIEDYEPLWKSIHRKHFPSKQDTFAIISKKYVQPNTKNVKSKSFFIQSKGFSEFENTSGKKKGTEKGKRKLEYKIPRELANRKPEGLYAWGGPGGGKTFLMGLMFDLLDVDNKLRMNYYEFMSKVHQTMFILEKVEDFRRFIISFLQFFDDIFYF
jgi:predicted ATPase